MKRMRLSQDGTTLVEVLMTVLIMSIAFVALAGGLWTSVVASEANVKLATAEATARALGEFLKRAAYVDCATTSSYSTSGFVVPTGYTTTISGVTYWESLAETFQSTCSTPDGGMQMLTFRVASTDGRATETIQMVKRK